MALRARGLAVLFVPIILAAAAADAAILHVPAEYLTIQAAVDSAAAGDTVEVACGTYYEHDIKFARSIVLQSATGLPDCVTIDAGELGRGLDISNVVGVTVVRGLTLTGGDATLANGQGGGLFCHTAGLQVIDCDFVDNFALNGGGVWGGQSSDLTLLRCRFRDNRAITGGGLYGRDWDGATVTECEFVNNAANAGGAAKCPGAIFLSCVFDSNSANDGGALDVQAATVDSCTFRGNFAQYRGGAVHGCATIRDCRIIDNRANDAGGGVLFQCTSSPSIERTILSGNSAGVSGGGMFVINYASITGCTFTENISSHTGGGITAADSPALIRSCTLVRNSATYGGGIFSAYSGHPTVDASIIAYSLSGAAVMFDGGSGATLSSTDLFGNEGGDWTDAVVSSLHLDGNFSADPLFCDLEAGDFTLAEGSPALRKNNVSDVLIGSVGQGCSGHGTVVSTSPPGLEFTVDGATYTGPTVFDWEPGSFHTIETIALQHPRPEFRNEFLAWSDGGAPVHQVVASANPRPLIARFRSTYFLTMEQDSGGTITPTSGWYDAMRPVDIAGVPEPDWIMLGWIGQGLGSYTGPSPTATIVMRGPVTESPQFTYIGTYPLTMVSQPGGAVTPESGDYPRGSLVPIQAMPDSAYLFTGWIGEGSGSYTGPDSAAVVRMMAPITQTATFLHVGTEPLKMMAQPGGTVSPPSGVYLHGQTIPILAVSDSGFVFDGWTGTGNGSYSGPDSAATVTMLEPITQIANFHYEGMHLLTMNVVGQGELHPGTGEQFPQTSVRIWVYPPATWNFHYWVGEGAGSYTGPERVVDIFMEGPITQTAYTAPRNGTFPLTMTSTEGGIALPPSGDFPAGGTVNIQAHSHSGFRFQGWQGTGPGSYSGPDSLATITMFTPVTQHAVFVPDGAPSGYELTISASDTDPHVNTDPPTHSMRSLWLWLTCTDRELSALEAGITGTLAPFAFVPDNGVLNIGQNGDLLLAVPGCPAGPDVNFLLGHWLVQDDGGDLCLAPSAANGVLGAVDCSPIPAVWEPVVTGFSSGGSAPCQIGTNYCTGGAGGPVDAVSVPTLPAPVYPTRFASIEPNPFRGTAGLRFSLAAPGRASLDIYDVTGRLVRTMLNAERPAGEYVLTWDGRADSGGRVSGGIYFVRFRAQDVTTTRRVVYLGR